MDDKEKDPTPDGSDDKEKVEKGEIREVGNAATDPEAFYDKSKSFFDKISCRAADAKRPDWKVEKKVNQETFGASGNFRPGRGRRGGFQRGRGGYRGGYSNGFNQGGFYGGEFMLQVKLGSPILRRNVSTSAKGSSLLTEGNQSFT